MSESRKTSKKTEMLKIRCKKEMFIKFKRFAAEFKNYEEALAALLESEERRRALERTREIAVTR